MATRSTRGRRRDSSIPRWTRMSDEGLLQLRLCDLGVRIEGSELEERIAQLHQELEARGIRFRPHCWLSNEWFSPAGVPGIAIPFYLAHPRLMKLEASQMLEVEGGTKRTCMQLLRHEAGHAIETAYRLGRRAKWRATFGRASKPYPEYYNPKPFSRNFVLHLDWWYAQSHPYEDFAETFAVWLLPGSQWRKRYKGWPVFRKLEYVDALMSEIAGAQPSLRSRRVIDPVHRSRQTLGEHYRAKQERYGSDYPDFYDRDLRRLFSDAPEDGHRSPAAAFLRRVAPELRRLVASWTGEHMYTLNLVLKEMTSRCRELHLRVARPEAELKLEAAVLLTMQTMNYMHSRDHRIPV